MTANQLEFAKIQETGRHNRVSERHEHYDTRTRRIGATAQVSQAETAARLAGETERHNRENEAIDWYRHRETISEQKRANRASEALGWYNAQVESEYKSRSAAVQERKAKVDELSYDVARMNAQTQLYSAETARLGQIEAGRHNLEQERQGRFSLSEIQRHNQASESIGAQQAQASWQQALAAQRNATTNLGSLMNQRAQTQLQRENTEIKRSLAQIQQGQLEKDWFDAYTRSDTLDLEKKRALSSEIRNWLGQITDTAETIGKLTK